MWRRNTRPVPERLYGAERTLGDLPSNDSIRQDHAQAETQVAMATWPMAKAWRGAVVAAQKPLPAWRPRNPGPQPQRGTGWFPEEWEVKPIVIEI
jgi:hypothetical protein